MDNITYIFGAGSSAQAMPLVNNFAKRFEIFKSYIDNYTTKGAQFYHYIESFGGMVKSHHTFDTFFKKLFHQNKQGETNIYKSVLLLFFIFEHLFTDEEIHLDEERKHFIVDPRYEALIAGLLKPLRGEIEFYQNINFITWNYDLNLMLALKNFIAPGENLIDFMNSRQEGNSFRINPQVQLFHLNGFVSHPILNKIGEKFISEKFQDVLNELSTGTQESTVDSIKFAWEQDINVFSKVAEKIANSKTVINIGYSFPLYNRLFDSQYLNPQTIGRKLMYVQNRDAAPIRDILESDFRISSRFESGEHKIIISENCDSFIVPNNIFSLL